MTSPKEILPQIHIYLIYFQNISWKLVAKIGKNSKFIFVLDKYVF